MTPVIQKAARVRGRNLQLRDVTVDDAEFVLGLRLDPRKSAHLSATSGDLQDQISWLRKYEASNDQAYFIVCDQDGQRLGCLRIYDPEGSSFCWGSWLMIDGLAPQMPLEAVLLVYAYCKQLGFKSARINVRKGNTYVWRFHENIFGARRTHETEDEFFYEVDEAQIDASLRKFAQWVPQPLAVLPLPPVNSS